MFKVRNENHKNKGISMRETRIAQKSIFENYSEHEFGSRLKALSKTLDQYPELLVLVAGDLIDNAAAKVGRTGLSAESVFRCLLLKQQLRVSYEQLAFHLSDSMTYRTFARLPVHAMPSRSGLQSAIRRIRPETLEKVHQVLVKSLTEKGIVSLDRLRIDSTVVASNIASPSDSQLLNDGVRVLSRILAKSKNVTGVKIRFVDQRKVAKSLAFRIFNAKNAEKAVLYPNLLRITRTVLKQVERGLQSVTENVCHSLKQEQ